MLDGIGHIGAAAVDPGRLHAAIEQLAGRPDEGVTGQILGIPGLLADEQDRGALRSLAEHGLRRVAEQWAGGAFGRRLAQLVELRVFRDQRRRGGLVGVVNIGHRSVRS